jgi:hypothetical protein
MNTQKNLLKEIKKIKGLINILESSDLDCEKQLEDSGYVVYNKKEQEYFGAECIDKEKIKCVYDVFQKIPNWKDRVNVRTTGSACFIEMKTKKTYAHDSGNWNKYYFNFWENGDFNIIGTFENDIFLKNSKENILQYMFQGVYECDVDNQKIMIKDFTYRGYMLESNIQKIIKKNIKDDKGLIVKNYFPKSFNLIDEFNFK